MKSLFLILFVFGSTVLVAQNVALIRTTIGAAGNSATSGYSGAILLNSTVGQASPIGKIEKGGITLLQGFQHHLRPGLRLINSSAQTMKVFPVPSTGDITLSWNENDIEEPVTLLVIAIDGKIAHRSLCERKSGRVQADLSLLSKGHYYLLLNGKESGTSSARIVLQ